MFGYRFKLKLSSFRRD